MTERILQFSPGRRRPEPGSGGSEASWKRIAIETAHSNMADFIGHVRDRSWFLQRDGGPRWSDRQWKFEGKRGRIDMRSCAFNTEPRSDVCLPEPFAEQSRAIVADILLRRPNSNPSNTMRALRLIFHAMADAGRTPDLVWLGQDIVDGFEATLEREVGKSTRWTVGTRLEEIVNDILHDRNLTVHPLTYHTKYRSRKSTGSVSHILPAQGPDGDEPDPNAKLPDIEAVLGLVDLFHDPGHEFRDLNLVTTAFLALALFAPSRALEILTLPLNCVTAADYKGGQRMGLMWRPAKGGNPMTKFAVTEEYGEVATEAVRRLSLLGAGARAAAAWYAENPGRLYLPPGMEHLRGKPLTVDETARIIGYEPGSGPGLRTACAMLECLRESNGSTGTSATKFSQESVRRFVKKYVDEYPGYLPSHLQQASDWLKAEDRSLIVNGSTELRPGQPLGIAESLSIIGLSESSLTIPNSLLRITRDFRKSDGPPRSGNSGGIMEGGGFRCEFASLEEWVLKRLPSTMPIVDPLTGLKLEDALFCLPRSILDGGKPTCWNIPDWISRPQIHGILSRPGSNNSVFAKNGILNPKTGKPRELKTHQLRHLLNTLAQKGYIPQGLIAFWSGRRNVHQNKDYNHVQQTHYIEAYQQAYGQPHNKVEFIRPLHDRAVNRSAEEMLTYQQSLKLDLGAAHVSRFGLCLHNFALSPCPHALDCVSCRENMLVAHDERTIQEARAQVAIQRKAVEDCKKAMREGKPGVERWLKLHTKKLGRWEAALKLLTDRNTKPGTMVALPADPDVRTAAEFAMDSRSRGSEAAPGKDSGSMKIQNQQKRRQ